MTENESTIHAMACAAVQELARESLSRSLSSARSETPKGNTVIEGIYLIGSLRNPEIPVIGNKLREAGYWVYDDWFATGPEADDYWKRYSQARGHTFKEALSNWAATHTYENDKFHLDQVDAAVLVMPAGKSGHLELGYMIGKGKPGYILLEPDVDRWDVMYKFAAGVFYSVDDLILELEGVRQNGKGRINHEDASEDRSGNYLPVSD